MFKRITPVLLSIALMPLSAMSSPMEPGPIKVKITAGNTVIHAVFDDNATSRALIEQFPLTLPMEDLYGREMCYRFPEPLPANEVSYSGYEVGDIVYWTPRHSLVIMYKQNGEKISNLQPIGHIATGVEQLGLLGDIDVTFELDSDKL